LKTILIVEDIDLNIDLLTQILEQDYEILVARDGAQGVMLAEQKKPDLILMDISLPLMDGYAATGLIRKSFPDLPIIGLSAHAMAGDAEKAIASGCNAYLTKPINEELLNNKIKELLE
jgi:two-component system, cell cycle response regulator DivK